MIIGTEVNKDKLFIPPLKMSIDSTTDLPFIPPQPLRPKSFFMYICGSAGSGKTTTWFQLLHSKPTKKNPNQPRFYNGLFDHIYLFSASIDTLENKRLKIHSDRMYDKYDGQVLDELLEEEKESGDNNNILFIFDDVIKDIQGQRKKENERILARLILNRRHITHNCENEDKRGGVSIIINSQKYNLLGLQFRSNISDCLLFRTSNNSELTSIHNELCADLSKDEFKALTEFVWDKPYNFLLVKLDKEPKYKYYKNFDRVQLDKNENKSENLNIE